MKIIAIYRWEIIEVIALYDNCSTPVTLYVGYVLGVCVGEHNSKRIILGFVKNFFSKVYINIDTQIGLLIFYNKSDILW